MTTTRAILAIVLAAAVALVVIYAVASLRGADQHPAFLPTWPAREISGSK